MSPRLRSRLREKDGKAHLQEFTTDEVAMTDIEEVAGPDLAGPGLSPAPSPDAGSPSYASALASPLADDLSGAPYDDQSAASSPPSQQQPQQQQQGQQEPSSARRKHRRKAACPQNLRDLRQEAMTSTAAAAATALPHPLLSAPAVSTPPPLQASPAAAAAAAANIAGVPPGTPLNLSTKMESALGPMGLLPDIHAKRLLMQQLQFLQPQGANFNRDEHGALDLSCRPGDPGAMPGVLLPPPPPLPPPTTEASGPQNVMQLLQAQLAAQFLSLNLPPPHPGAPHHGQMNAQLQPPVGGYSLAGDSPGNGPASGSPLPSASTGAASSGKEDLEGQGLKSENPQDLKMAEAQQAHTLRFANFEECGNESCARASLRDHCHCISCNKVLPRRDDLVRHMRWHIKRENALENGFMRFSAGDDCERPNCSHKHRQTHYHCIRSNCDKVYISTSDCQMHSNYHKKYAALLEKGFLRFRASDDCRQPACPFRNDRTTHFHCTRKDCNYFFKNKADCEKHSAHHNRNDCLAKENFRKYLKYEDCNFQGCKYNRTMNHIHCLVPGCNYVVHSMGQTLPHKRKHERRGEVGQVEDSGQDSFAMGPNAATQAPLMDLTMPKLSLPPPLPAPQQPPPPPMPERRPEPSELPALNGAPPEEEGEALGNRLMLVASPKAEPETALSLTEGGAECGGEAGHDLKLEVGRLVEAEERSDAWRRHFLRFTANDACVPHCPMLYQDHYHCQAPGCRQTFKTREKVREHARNHSYEAIVTAKAFRLCHEAACGPATNSLPAEEPAAPAPEEEEAAPPTNEAAAPGDEAATPEEKFSPAAPVTEGAAHFHCLWPSCAFVTPGGADADSCSFPRLAHYKTHDLSCNMTRKRPSIALSSVTKVTGASPPGGVPVPMALPLRPALDANGTAMASNTSCLLPRRRGRPPKYKKNVVVPRPDVPPDQLNDDPTRQVLTLEDFLCAPSGVFCAFKAFQQGTACPDDKCQFSGRLHFHCLRPRCYHASNTLSEVNLHRSEFHAYMSIQEGFEFFDTHVCCRRSHCHNSKTTRHYHCTRRNCDYAFVRHNTMEQHAKRHLAADAGRMAGLSLGATRPNLAPPMAALGRPSISSGGNFGHGGPPATLLSLAGGLPGNMSAPRPQGPLPLPMNQYAALAAAMMTQGPANGMDMGVLSKHLQNMIAANLGMPLASLAPTSMHNSLPPLLPIPEVVPRCHFAPDSCPRLACAFRPVEHFHCGLCDQGCLDSLLLASHVAEAHPGAILAPPLLSPPSLLKRRSSEDGAFSGPAAKRGPGSPHDAEEEEPEELEEEEEDEELEEEGEAPLEEEEMEEDEMEDEEEEEGPGGTSPIAFPPPEGLEAPDRPLSNSMSSVGSSNASGFEFFDVGADCHTADCEFARRSAHFHCTRCPYFCTDRKKTMTHAYRHQDP